MLNAIKSVAEGATYLGPKVAASLQKGAKKTGVTANTYGLTKREKQVLTLIAEGHLNKEIAYRLDISIRTVESHRSAIRDKTGGGNAATLARLHGIWDCSLATTYGLPRNTRKIRWLYSIISGSRGPAPTL